MKRRISFCIATASALGLGPVQAAPGVSENVLLMADLETARAATAHLQRFDNAINEGWDVPVTDCKEDTEAGGMGYHWASFDRYLDGIADISEPEVLLYEPQPDGSLRLVALEYTIPAFAWRGGADEAPRMFGREMHWDATYEEWILHVWLWKNNPAGMFADWNPNVSCKFAD